ncbi:hypothetical protein SCLCIDRAFT_1218515 [Scleroderma citrinum Foug A]|uniref:Uncharacterized protein n=1 Tax=Scleroderma citrinum Foug A TaxID=1036808 RepID=A0A0C3DQU7_9AGAM|nr:hypothetical protein SCLCIDRAFT_1218515 [Scleroderma citrinum Foug A]
MALQCFMSSSPPSTPNWAIHLPPSQFLHVPFCFPAPQNPRNKHTIFLPAPEH